MVQSDYRFRSQGLSGARQGGRRVQRAFDMLRDAFDAESITQGHDGEPIAYGRFVIDNFPPAANISTTPVEVGD